MNGIFFLVLLSISPVFKTDAWLHSSVSFGISSFTYGVVRDADVPHYKALGIAASGTLCVGVAKEVRDEYFNRNPKSHWNWNDIAWDVVGTAVSVCANVGINELIHTIKRKHK